jgi:hypothetical protein
MDIMRRVVGREREDMEVRRVMFVDMMGARSAVKSITAKKPVMHGWQAWLCGAA